MGNNTPFFFLSPFHLSSIQHEGFHQPSRSTKHYLNQNLVGYTTATILMIFEGKIAWRESAREKMKKRWEKQNKSGTTCGSWQSETSLIGCVVACAPWLYERHFYFMKEKLWLRSINVNSYMLGVTHIIPTPSNMPTQQTGMDLCVCRVCWLLKQFWEREGKRKKNDRRRKRKNNIAADNRLWQLVAVIERNWWKGIKNIVHRVYHNYV